MRILIVGPLKGYGNTAAKIAMKRGAKVSQVNTIDQALGSLRAGQGADLVMVDLELDIANFTKSLREERIHADVVACGVTTDPNIAAAAIRAGAKEYIPLPPDPELISAVVEAVSTDDSEVIFKDPKMDEIIQLADKVAPSQANILITGESGTGKEVMARYIHKKSKRAKKPFISVNCAAIPENLLESELFGHEKGSFTGAVARRIGKFEEANGGTLLLDEISEMHPSLQAKLLRAVQERMIDRVGGEKPVPIDIRIIATSNRDMLKAVQNKEFREDLYFRLNVINLVLPALRERPYDIEILVHHFADKYAKMNVMPVKAVHPLCIKKLQAYRWPGNVRELENMIHRAVLLSQETEITEDDINLPTLESHIVTTKDFVGRSVAGMEQVLILDTLNHCLGNRTHAANILGISIRTLRNKLKEYASAGIEIPEAKNATS